MRLVSFRYGSYVGPYPRRIMYQLQEVLVIFLSPRRTIQPLKGYFSLYSNNYEQYSYYYCTIIYPNYTKFRHVNQFLKLNLHHSIPKTTTVNVIIYVGILLQRAYAKRQIYILKTNNDNAFNY